MELYLRKITVLVSQIIYFTSHNFIPFSIQREKKKSCLNKPPLYEMRLKRIKDIILVENLIK